MYLCKIQALYYNQYPILIKYFVIKFFNIVVHLQLCLEKYTILYNIEMLRLPYLE